MAEYKGLDDFLLQDCGGKFKDKSWFFGLFGGFVFTPTGEKVVDGFRYFSCDADAVLAHFADGDIAALSQLPFALDDDGDPDTSSVLISFRYTASGSAIAMQVEEYQNYRPVPVSPVVLLEGAKAQARIAAIKELDQSN